MRHCFYHTDQDRVQYFAILQYKLHSFNIQNDRSARGLLARRLKNIQNHLYGQPVLTFAVRAVSSFWMNINRVTLQHNKEFITFIFYLMVLSMCNLQKRLIRAAFWVLLQAMFTERLKTNGTAIKLQERLLSINKRNRIRWNIYRDNNFHSRRQVLKCLKKSWD